LVIQPFARAYATAVAPLVVSISREKCIRLVWRPSVRIAANKLQNAKLITYSRGLI
jgi:hypothetical protein